MMHGSFAPHREGGTTEGGGWQRLAALLRRRKWILVVGLPTLLLSLYYGFVATPQFESEAHFMVRSTGGAPAAVSAAGALSLLGGMSNASTDTASVSDYLSSHDAVDSLRKHYRLVEIFTRPNTDFFSKLTPADPTPERLVHYFNGQASVKLDDQTGITAIRVRTFRPEDSYALVNAMLKLGEERINVLNRRAYQSSIAVGERQVHDAEQAVESAQAAITRFRQGKRNIDPVATGQAQINVVSSLQADLARTRAARSAMTGSIRSNSPQALATDARIRALEGQVVNESGRLAGSDTAIAAKVGDYQGLLLRQQFASKRYDDAAALLQRARDQANKQQLFIVRVVEPNVPVKALYPKGFRVTLTVFIGLVLTYACGWLIAAGVREHSA